MNYENELQEHTKVNKKLESDPVPPKTQPITQDGQTPNASHKMTTNGNVIY